MVIRANSVGSPAFFPRLSNRARLSATTAESTVVPTAPLLYKSLGFDRFEDAADMGAKTQERDSFYFDRALAAIGAIGLVLRFVGVLPAWKLAIAPFSFVDKLRCVAREIAMRRGAFVVVKPFSCAVVMLLLRAKRSMPQMPDR